MYNEWSFNEMLQDAEKIGNQENFEKISRELKDYSFFNKIFLTNSSTSNLLETDFLRINLKKCQMENEFSIETEKNPSCDFSFHNFEKSKKKYKQKQNEVFNNSSVINCQILYQSPKNLKDFRMIYNEENLSELTNVVQFSFDALLKKKKHNKLPSNIFFDEEYFCKILNLLFNQTEKNLYKSLKAASFKIIFDLFNSSSKKLSEDKNLSEENITCPLRIPSFLINNNFQKFQDNKILKNLKKKTSGRTILNHQDYLLYSNPTTVHKNYICSANQIPSLTPRLKFIADIMDKLIPLKSCVELKKNDNELSKEENYGFKNFTVKDFQIYNNSNYSKELIKSHVETDKISFMSFKKDQRMSNKTNKFSKYQRHKNILVTLSKRLLAIHRCPKKIEPQIIYFKSRKEKYSNKQISRILNKKWKQKKKDKTTSSISNKFEENNGNFFYNKLNKFNYKNIENLAFNDLNSNVKVNMNSLNQKDLCTNFEHIILSLRKKNITLISKLKRTNNKNQTMTKKRLKYDPKIIALQQNLYEQQNFIKKHDFSNQKFMQEIKRLQLTYNIKSEKIRKQNITCNCTNNTNGSYKNLNVLQKENIKLYLELSYLKRTYRDLTLKNEDFLYQNSLLQEELSMIKDQLKSKNNFISDKLRSMATKEFELNKEIEDLNVELNLKIKQINRSNMNCSLTQQYLKSLENELLDLNKKCDYYKEKFKVAKNNYGREKQLSQKLRDQVIIDSKNIIILTKKLQKKEEEGEERKKKE